MLYTHAVRKRDIIVVGASAGGVEALKELVRQFPPSFDAAIFIALHILAGEPSYLPRILSQAGPLPAIHPTDGMPIAGGHIYVAPPNRHLMVEYGHVHLHSGPKENRHRPAVNPLFRSAALAYGPRAIGIVLSGNFDDGTVGLWEIKRRGGIAIAQDPYDASYPGMPSSAIANVDVDYQLKVSEMGALLTKLVQEAPTVEAKDVGGDMQGKPTRLTCPECRGPLDEFQEGQLREMRCRVGHTFSPETLLSAHEETLERALWGAVVALEEGRDISRQLQEFKPREAARLKQEEKEKEQMASQLRRMIGQLTEAETSSIE
jgi:two-component system chemotaxis response regulator CheB